jgi:hypothetical protein
LNILFTFNALRFINDQTPRTIWNPASTIVQVKKALLVLATKHRTTTMKSIAGRIQRLEEGFLPAPETESSRLLRARIEAGRRRLRENVRRECAG